MTLLLDAITTQPTFAVSVRRLRSGYAGNCLQVRRSSDNTTQNIGFVSDYLDTASLLTFCGAGNGFITKWYDQSANAYEARQTTTSVQPKIVAAGVLVTESANTLAAIRWDDATKQLVVTTSGGTAKALSTIIATNAMTGYCVIRPTTIPTTNTAYFGAAPMGDGNGGGSYFGLKLYNTTSLGIYTWDGGEKDAVITVSTGTRYVTEMRLESNVEYIKANAITEVSHAVTTGPQVLTGQFALGATDTGPSDYIMQEVVVYNSALTSGDRSTLKANIDAYFANNPNASITPSGVVGTAALGTLTKTGDANNTPTGVSSTSAIGTLTASTITNANTTPTGVIATSGLGTIVASVPISKSITGLSTASGLGTLTKTGTANTTPTGIVATSGLGTITPAISILLTGNAATGSPGTIHPEVDALPAGVNTASGLGTITTSVIIPAYPVAISATGSVGTLTATSASNITLVGNAATGGLGTIITAISESIAGNATTGNIGTAFVAVSAITSGVQTTNSLGTVSLVIASSTIPVGISTSGTLGTPIAHSSSNIVPTGLAATAGLGTTIPAVSAVTAGVSGTGNVGSLREDLITFIAKVLATSHVGVMIPTLPVAIVGQHTTASLGLLEALGSVGLTGVYGTGTTNTVAISSGAKLVAIRAVGHAGNPGVSTSVGSLVSVYGTSSVGSLDPEGKVRPTGVQATDHIGTLHLGTAYTAPGISISGSVGDPLPNASATLDLTGLAATSHLGTVLEKMLTTIAGIKAYGFAGSFAFNVSALLASASTTSYVGTLIEQCSALLTTLQAKGRQGTLTIHTSPNITLAGLIVTGHIGLPIGQVSPALSAVIGTGHLGTLKETITEFLFGVQTTSGMYTLPLFPRGHGMRFRVASEARFADTEPEIRFNLTQAETRYFEVPDDNDNSNR